MDQLDQLQTGTGVESAEVSKVLRQTYTLLGMCFVFSAAMAAVAGMLNVPHLGLWNLLPFIGLLWMVEKNKNNSSGIFWTFAFTGWLGFSAGPIISMVASSAGYEPIIMALGGTGLIFFGLSGYVLTTRKDLSFMSGFVLVGLLVAFVAGIANVFFQIQGLALAVSSMFLLLSSAMIAIQTSSIIHGGERNYISATVTLFVSLYNVFMSLLQLIMAFGGGDD